MARRDKTAEAAPPVDTEDDDRRGSTEDDEHRGLAKRILELRRALEVQRVAGEKALSDLRQLIALQEQTVATAVRQVDMLLKEWERRSRDLESTQREAGEQVRAAGEQVRRLQDELKALEELRETQADPHDVVKPLRKDIGEIKHELLLLTKNVDYRFEQLPRPKAQPWEMRGDDEDPFLKMGRQIRALEVKVNALLDDDGRARA